MSLQKRTLAALSGVLMAFLIALGAVPAAQAADSTTNGTRVTSVSDNGLEPRAARSADAGVLAEPGVSPGAERTYSNRTNSQAYDLVRNCASGRFCTYQQQGNGLYKVFQFYRCGDYQLSNWFDARMAKNNQTGGVTVRLLGSSGGQVDTVTAGQHKAVSWDPVWTIRLCG